MRDIANRHAGYSAVARARSRRRPVARERHHHCAACGFERRSWIALRSCPSCGTPLSDSQPAGAPA